MKLGLLVSAIGLLGLVSCSSAPKSTDQLSMDSRSQYIGDVRETLAKWEDRASKLNNDRATDLRASISDARAELRSLQDAPTADWQTYRSRVNSRLDHIQELYGQAKAE